MHNKIEEMLTKSSLLSEIARAVSDCGMEALIFEGTLVGLSGGADSVMLLLYLVYLKRQRDFPLLAVHVNHGIRGDEATRDERFSERLCDALGVEFLSVRLDVPAIARKCGKGIEEAARDARYSAFAEIISGREDINTVAVAHNADDNLETVIMNMMRGAGTRGMSGIAPVRDNVVRPLIYIEKSDIVAALTEFGFDFVTDSTNESDDYTRNYIRHNITPALMRAFSSPADSVSVMCRNLRDDDGCLQSMAGEIALRYNNGTIPRSELVALHPALLFRVLNIYAENAGVPHLERVHFDAFRRCLEGGKDFSVSVVGAELVSRGGFVGFLREPPSEPENFSIPLSFGKNVLKDRGALIEIVKKKSEFSSNVYNNSTQADLTSAIIVGDLFVRNKVDGDTVSYGGMTRKLKRLFSDAKIPTHLRHGIPILCDSRGVVWVPGFGVRDDGGTSPLHIRISVTDDGRGTFYLPERRERIKKKGEKVT